MIRWISGIVAVGVLAFSAYILNYMQKAEEAKAQNPILRNQVAAGELALAGRDMTIAALNARIQGMNAATEQRIARERERVATANAAADEIRQERDRIAGQLSESQRRFNDQLETRPDLREWVADAVPAPVWGRLRVARGP